MVRTLRSKAPTEESGDPPPETEKEVRTLRSKAPTEESVDPPPETEKEVRTLRSKAPTEESGERPETEKEDSKIAPKDSLNRLKTEESKRSGSGSRRKDGQSKSKEEEEEKRETRDKMDTDEKEEESGSTSKKAAYGCQLAPKLPPGEKVKDARGNHWILGRPIGSGGFGDIYLCDQGQEECPEEAR